MSYIQSTQVRAFTSSDVTLPGSADTASARRARRSLGRLGRWSVIGAVAASVLTLSGCGVGGAGSTGSPVMLSGARTDIIVAVPSGWHQLIDTSNPVIPEMVAPTTCIGGNEVACATGLARIASLTAPSVQDAEQTIEQAVTTTTGVTMGETLSQGPGKVGKRDGYQHRFTFTNPAGKLTCQISAVASGPATLDAQGNQEFSVVLVWVTDKPGAPTPDVIDRIVGSAKVAGGIPPTS